MSTQTSLGLVKPDPITDFYDVAVQNANMDKINAELVGRYSKTYVDGLLLKTSGTIPITGWVANTGDYAYKLNLAISGVVATDFVDMSINPDDVNVAMDAELCPTITEYAGGVTLYVKAVPAATIGFTCLITKSK